MTQVDFYILKNAQITHNEQFACLLVEKAFKKGHKVHIHTTDNNQTARMDRLLWTYSDQSFLPHVTMDDELQQETPINISHNQDKASISDVLINLRSEVPSFYKQFNRVAELVPADADAKQAARLRYREYQQQGCTVTSHEINR
jgi:DNA polymerase-3 subunit chi